MIAADSMFNRYDPWYVKVAYGLFVTLLVGVSLRYCTLLQIISSHRDVRWAGNVSLCAIEI